MDLGFVDTKIETVPKEEYRRRSRRRAGLGLRAAAFMDIRELIAGKRLVGELLRGFAA